MSKKGSRVWTDHLWDTAWSGRSIRGMGVLNPRRIAWEGAGLFVAASNSRLYGWLSEVVGEHLGVMYQLKLAETRLRLQLEDATFEETAAWRARLDELLDRRPAMAPLLTQLVRETAERRAGR